MTGLLVTLVFGLSPGITLADGAPTRSVHAYKPRIVLADYVQDVGLMRMNREQIQEEMNRLDHDRPTFTGPIILLSIGGVLGIGGLVGAFVANEIYITTLCALVAIGGGVLVVVGAIQLLIRLVRMSDYREQLDICQRRIDDLDRNGRVPDAPPPPPPPPPPGASFFKPEPNMLVAVF
jgi:hypothetical protein